MATAPLNVLFVVNSLHFGGAEKHAIALLNNLDNAQFKLSLAYLKNDTEMLPQLDIDRLAGGVHLCEVRRRLDFSAIRNLADLIEAGEIDLVVCTNCYPLANVVLAKQYVKRKFSIVEVFHTTELGGLKAKLQMMLYRPFFAVSDLLVYVCNNQRDYWNQRKLKAKAIKVIHNGINVDYFCQRSSTDEIESLRAQFGFAPSDFVVGLCAVMRPEKAHGDLLQAIHLLKQRGIMVKALLIGDGVERTNIEAQIAALDLGDAVKISGFATDVRPYISACDAMALVSHAVETFSIAALEAMALGRPMIMSRIGGATEQIEDKVNGLLFERGDIEALTRSLAYLSDRERCKQMGELARTTVVEKFSINAMTAGFAKAFVDLHASGGNGLDRE